ncbi:hypothetical protein [Vreelandella olivaria]|nr:hypothetical protein [Halomonas olivaria]
MQTLPQVYLQVREGDLTVGGTLIAGIVAGASEAPFMNVTTCNAL